MKRAKKITFYVLIPIFSLFLFSASYRYNDPFDALLSSLKNFSVSHAREKLHLHLDKPVYNVGEDIWLKGYLFHSQLSAPSDLSKIMYVELVDHDGKVLESLKLPVIGSLSWGNLKLPDTIQNGNYWIRGYTHYMKNFGTEDFFEKKIYISNPSQRSVEVKAELIHKDELLSSKIQIVDITGKPFADKVFTYSIVVNGKRRLRRSASTNQDGKATINIDKKISDTTARLVINEVDGIKVNKTISLNVILDETNIQFLPEGGVLLEDMAQRIAIKSVNSSGKGEDIEGSVLDDAGNVVTSFQTNHLGMGSFITNFKPGSSYIAEVKFRDGSKRRIKLPQPIKSGYSLSIDNSGQDQVKVRILASADKPKDVQLKLLAHQHGNTIYAARVTLSTGFLNIPFERTKLPDGVIQFTLFDEQTRPIVERLVFNRNKGHQIDISIQGPNLLGNDIEHANFRLEAKVAGKATLCNFSVAVSHIEKSGVNDFNDSNIYTSLLLTGELNGLIENPSHYFAQDSKETRNKLDNLMLTQGWRKIVWQELLQDRLPNLLYSPEKALMISGSIRQKNKPVPGLRVGLMSKTNGILAINTITDQNGRFVYDKLFFAGSTEFTFSAGGLKGGDIDIEIDNRNQKVPISEKLEPMDFEVDSLAVFFDSNQKYFQEMKRMGIKDEGRKLKEVTITERRKKVLNSANLNGAGNADRVLTSEDLKFTSGSLLNDISNRMHLKTLRRVGNPLYVLDGNSNVTADIINNIPSSEIESVELLMNVSRTAIYGVRGSGGVMIITTKKGIQLPNLPADGLKNFTLQGYNVTKEFYQSPYPQGQNNVDSFKPTIYWNPLVVTDQNGFASFDFNNIGEPGLYRILVEGVSLDGAIGRKVFSFRRR